MGKFLTGASNLIYGLALIGAALLAFSFSFYVGSEKLSDVAGVREVLELLLILGLLLAVGLGLLRYGIYVLRNLGDNHGSDYINH